MKTHTFTSTSTFALAALLGASLVATAQTPAPGQGRGQTGQTQPGQTPTGSAADRTRADQAGARPGALSVQRFERLSGTKIKTAQGEEIGQLEDLVFGPNGEVTYGVVSFGKIDGMADKWYFMPWSNVQYRGPDGVAVGRDGSIIIAVEKERLKNAPGFDKNTWPIRKAGDTTARTELPFGEVDKFYERDVRATGRAVNASARAGASTILRASEIRGRTIETANGETVGPITDVVIDPVSGRLNYVVVGSGDRLVAVPWEALRSGKAGPGGNDALILPLTKDRLMSAPEFQRGDARWTEMSEPTYIQRVYDFYSVRPYWSDTAKDGSREVRPGADDTRRQPVDRKDDKRKDEPPKNP